MLAFKRAESRWSLALLVLLAALLACKKKSPPDSTPAPAPPPVSTTQEQAKKLKPETKTLLEKLAGMAEKVKAEPAVKRTKAFDTKLEKGKFIVVGDKWLNEVHRDPSESEIDLDNTVLSLCGYAVEKEDELKDDDVKYMQECLAWEYIAVVRPKTIAMPRINLAAKTFTPGDVIGDCFLFEIKSGEIKGRYKLHTTNSDSITYTEGKSENDWLDMAKADLVSNARGVVEERLQHERDSMGD